MRWKYILASLLTMACTILAISVAIRMIQNNEAKPLQAKVKRTVTIQKIVKKRKPEAKKTVKMVPEPKPEPFLSGTLRELDGSPMSGVTVSNGIECVLTDSLGKYKLHNDSTARFIYYTIPAYCEVPTHSATDRTANFYLPIVKNKTRYDFTLRRLPNGVEKEYKMIVIGDPQVTNAFNPYYNTPDDNRVEQSDVDRFATETMVDIRHTIRAFPKGMPVYGLSMGDDVQYYGGYNPMLERQIREVLGSSEMRIFSVIGNHDQDGKAEYRTKWEENWGPTDYSFDRGNEHYICFNNVHFLRKGGYYSPGELTDRQFEWLRQDLALTPKSKKVVLCYHIPLTFGNNPSHLAHPLTIETEHGHYASSRLSALLQMLLKFKGGYELFCGHTHFAINHEINFEGHHIMEHCHAAACGNIWQSNINICGTPNGYYVYTFKDTHIQNAYYKGTFWEADKQMTLFLADMDFNGESYAADWNLPHGKGIVVANVFNTDSRWQVYAEEDGEQYPTHRISSKGQDAFATGYHHKYEEATSFHFISKQNSYLLMNHLYYYVPKHPNADIRIFARDPYGNTFSASTEDIITEPFHNYAHYYENER